MSRPCEAACKGSDMGFEDPCDGAFDGRLGVLGQPAAAIEPSEGAFDHPRQRVSLAPAPFARHHDECVVDLEPGAILHPAIRISLHRRGRRKFLRQRALLAAGRGHVEDRVHNRPKLGVTQRAKPVRPRHERRNQRPLVVRRIACVTQARSPILPPGDLGPGHRNHHRIVADRRNHKPIQTLTCRLARP